MVWHAYFLRWQTVGGFGKCSLKCTPGTQTSMHAMNKVYFYGRHGGGTNWSVCVCCWLPYNGDWTGTSVVLATNKTVGFEAATDPLTHVASFLKWFSFPSKHRWEVNRRSNETHLQNSKKNLILFFILCISVYYNTTVLYVCHICVCHIVKLQ